MIYIRKLFKIIIISLIYALVVIGFLYFLSINELYTSNMDKQMTFTILYLFIYIFMFIGVFGFLFKVFFKGVGRIVSDKGVVGKMGTLGVAKRKNLKERSFYMLSKR